MCRSGFQVLAEVLLEQARGRSSSRSRVNAANAGRSAPWWKIRSVSMPESVTSTAPSSWGRAADGAAVGMGRLLRRPPR